MSTLYGVPIRVRLLIKSGACRASSIPVQPSSAVPDTKGSEDHEELEISGKTFLRLEPSPPHVLSSRELFFECA